MPIPEVSPIQAAMLRRSLVAENGENIEQVEINFTPSVAMHDVGSAWLATVEHTAALRTAFQFLDGEPTHLISLTDDAPIRIEQTIPESWQAWLASDRLNPLPLATGLPWRAVIWPEARKLIWTFHHALLDGRSIAKILTKFQAHLCHAGDLLNLDLAFAPTPSAEEITAAQEFHRLAFASLDACQPEFPFDHGKGPAQLHRCLGAEKVTLIESVANDLGVTSPTLITWAWGQAAATAAGARAVAVGQVRSGPPRPGQAGFSMNTVPLVIPRAQPGPAQPFLLEFRKHLLAMRQIENVSVEQLPPGIFQETGGPWPGGILMVERGTLHHQVGELEGIEALTLHEFSGEPLIATALIHPELRLEVEVNGQTHGARAAATLLDHWATILQALADGVFENASDLTALPAGMRDALDHWETGGEARPQVHLAPAWHQAAEAFATHCAVWTPSTAITYADLAAKVEHLAACLQEAGATPGNPVVSLLFHQNHLPIVLLAIARLGAIYVPLDPALPERRLRTKIEDSGTSLILTDTPAACEWTELPYIVVDGSIGKSCTAELPGTPHDPLSILYTSGSTGTPKGVIMVNGGVVNEVNEMARLAGIGPGSRVLQFASPGFDASLEEILGTLLNGATLIPRPQEISTDLHIFQSFIRQAEITVLDLPTAFWTAWCAWMVSKNESIPQNIKTTIIGGERASAAALKDWFAAGGRPHLLVNTYGPTEASIVATAQLIGADWHDSGDPSIGRPLPGVHARIADSSLRRLPHGAAGELWLGGPCLSAGYWNRPDLTSTAFHKIDGFRWYRTGDRVCRDDDGDIHFLGRQDEQMKIRGHRIEPNEVIRVLETFPGVSAAFVGPWKNPHGTTFLAAWVRWNDPPQDGWPAKLAAHAAHELSSASTPTRWALVAEFILTERGKLDRNQLPEPNLTASAQTSSDPPATLIEKRLAETWSKLLGIVSIGRDESFFELGGNSLAAAQLFAAIYQEWKVRIPMATLIRAATPRLLGAIIEQECSNGSSSQKQSSMIIPIRPAGDFPPLFCIHGGDGGVFFYRDLTEHLPPGRPLLAIEAPALATDGAVQTVSVEDTAAAYLAALRQYQDKGPFHLIGYSYGGLIVYEIARQLLAKGETIGFAGMVDTVNPATVVRKYGLIERISIFWKARANLSVPHKIYKMIARAIAGAATHIRVKKELHSAKNAGITEPHSALRMLQVRDAHWTSMEAYQPGPLSCQVTLFKSREIDDKFEIPGDYGWSRVVDSLDIAEVGGEHLEMFAKEHITEIAEKIHARLA